MLQKIITNKKAAFILMLVTVTIAVSAAEPGSVDDPLVSKSYIDTVLMPQIESMINAAPAVPSGESGASDRFVVISLSKGDRMICDAGTELIIRMGDAKIIATAKGGISDVTGGEDLPNNATAPSNHHLIVPVNDGRGLLALGDMLVMVRGGYSLE